MESEVSDVLAGYVVGGFLGDYPRDDFVDAFADFTSTGGAVRGRRHRGADGFAVRGRLGGDGHRPRRRAVLLRRRRRRRWSGHRVGRLRLRRGGRRGRAYDGQPDGPALSRSHATTAGRSSATTCCATTATPCRRRRRREARVAGRPAGSPAAAGRAGAGDRRAGLRRPADDAEPGQGREGRGVRRRGATSSGCWCWAPTPAEQPDSATPTPSSCSRIDARTGAAAGIGIPRDTYVDLPATWARAGSTSPEGGHGARPGSP